MKEKILVVEDQFIEANSLKKILEGAGYHVCEIARSVEKALAILDKEAPGFVLLDIFLQGALTGIDLAYLLRERNIPFIYVSANSNQSTLQAAKATRPYGFLLKPFRKKDVLVALEIGQYLHEHGLESVIRKGQAGAGMPVAQPAFQRELKGIIGNSPGFRLVLEHLSMVAPYDTSVLILGESGTGKERIAEAIHELSRRRSKPLVKVNCAAMPANLIESILFGHERGAFTGATERRIGKFEQAGEGTIFLDEIGEMSPDLQIKLLRVLQEKEIERIGSADTIKVNVRLIAATNKDLEKEVAEGRFRLDLYYRLNAFPLLLPPLRERREDIPELIRYFLQMHSVKMNIPPVGISEKAMEALLNHHWPGNIRELEHVLERALVLCEQKTIREISLPASINPAPPGTNNPASTTGTKVKTIEENERDHIISVLKMCGGKIFGKGGAAEILGLNSATLYSRIRKMGIEVSKTYL
jgi:two-component system, NtrC family, response regulator HydG